MARLQKESGYSMSFRLREIQELEERITRDEFRMDEINDVLMERDLLNPDRETDLLIQEWHNLNSRVEQGKNRLVLLKAPSELTEEEKKIVPKPKNKERFNINH